jgi:hypothetical protein
MYKIYLKRIKNKWIKKTLINYKLMINITTNERANTVYGANPKPKDCRDLSYFARYGAFEFCFSLIIITSSDSFILIDINTFVKVF